MAQCCSLFGIELMNISSRQFEEIQVQWRKSVRYLLDLHPRTHNSLLHHITGSPSIESIIYSRIICFIKRGLEHENKFISFFFNNSVYNLHSYTSRNMYLILRRRGISYAEFRAKSENWLKQKCKAEQAPDWIANTVIELLQCRDGLLETNLQQDQLKDILNHLCTQ